MTPAAAAVLILRSAREEPLRNLKDRRAAILAAVATVMDAARAEERERVEKWLLDGGDQIAEDLCEALMKVGRDQRQAGYFGGYPYFKLFADALAQSHREPKP